MKKTAAEEFCDVGRYLGLGVFLGHVRGRKHRWAVAVQEVSALYHRLPRDPLRQGEKRRHLEGRRPGRARHAHQAQRRRVDVQGERPVGPEGHEDGPLRKWNTPRGPDRRQFLLDCGVGLDAGRVPALPPGACQGAGQAIATLPTPHPTTSGARQ